MEDDPTEDAMMDTVAPPPPQSVVPMNMLMSSSPPPSLMMLASTVAPTPPPSAPIATPTPTPTPPAAQLPPKRKRKDTLRRPVMTAPQFVDSPVPSVPQTTTTTQVPAVASSAKKRKSTSAGNVTACRITTTQGGGGITGGIRYSDDEDDPEQEDRDNLAATVRQRFPVGGLSDGEEDDGKGQQVGQHREFEAGGVEFEFPVGLIGEDSEGWRSEFGEVLKEELSRAGTMTQELWSLLPGGQEGVAIEELLGMGNVFFGNPMSKFLSDLREGMMGRSVQQYRREYRALRYRDYLQGVRQYNSGLLAKAVAFRRSLGLPCNLAPARAPFPQDGEEITDSGSSGDEMLAEERLSRTPRQRADLRKARLAATSHAPQQSHRPSAAHTAQRVSLPPPSSTASAAVSHTATAAAAAAMASLSMKEQHAPAVVPSGTPPYLLFSTLESIFASSPGGAPVSFDAVVSRIEQVPMIRSDIPAGLSVREIVQMAVNFLSVPPTPGSPGLGSSQMTTNLTASGFPPFMRRAGPDGNMWLWCEKRVSRNNDEDLQTMEQLFWFAVTRKQYNEEHTEANMGTASRQQKCTVTLTPLTPEQVADYRRQEVERYKVPELPFQITLTDGNKVFVAPLKKGNPQNKPREHFILRTERPAHINILPLVRDAAARLPGGVGTRPDVALLLKDSAYIVDNVPDNQMNTIVSGALDRLHAEKDPCVRFDPEQKLWVYLHRHRTFTDFPPPTK